MPFQDIRSEDQEKTIRESRTRPVLGAHALRLSRMDVHYTPKKRGKRMICLSSCRDFRKLFIQWYKDLCATGAEVRALWSVGDWRASLPPGLFSPDGFMHSYLNPMFVPVVANNLV